MREIAATLAHAPPAYLRATSLMMSAGIADLGHQFALMQTNSKLANQFAAQMLFKIPMLAAFSMTTAVVSLAIGNVIEKAFRNPTTAHKVSSFVGNLLGMTAGMAICQAKYSWLVPAAFGSFSMYQDLLV